MFVENFQKFLRYYGKGRKIRILGFCALSLVAGMLEFLGIALIYPFIMLVITPSAVVHTKYYKYIASLTHFDNVLYNAFVIGVLVVILFIVKNLFMIFSSYLQNKFTVNWKNDLNKRFMGYYLFSSYKNSLKTSSAQKIYNLDFLTSQTLDGFVLRGINLITNTIIVLIILSLLFVKFPLATIITAVFVIFTMAVQNRIFKKFTAEIAKKLMKISVLKNAKVHECIMNLKELKILSAEKYFYDEYLHNQCELNGLLFKNGFYASIPPYIIEILIVISLLILTAIISVQNLQNTSGIIASYAVVVAAIFRIAPALNRIQTSINMMNGSRDFVKAMNEEYENTDFEYILEKSDKKFEFRKKFQLDNISFSYDGIKNIINNLSLCIEKGEFVGIIGLSGAGKSTLADIIMGLLPVDSGSVLIDGVEISQKDFSALRKLIGYVPQQINILDVSFKENVAWGFAAEEIDEAKVVNALKKAQLWDLVNSYKEGINANVIVGSNGLSQGQKQRLAIARALYRDPEILIFDEATSSLDVETEHEITKMLSTLKGEKTIIAIAHRLSTLKACDKLIYLKAGQIVDTGSFKELSGKHIDFEKLIRLSNIEAV